MQYELGCDSLIPEKHPRSISVIMLQKSGILFSLQCLEDVKTKEFISCEAKTKDL